MPAIEVDGLVVRYGTRTAVDGLTLSSEPGQVVALLGPNGAGKTTTVEVLEGYRRPSGGRVRVLGLDPVADHRALTFAMGVMLQRGGPYPRLDPRRALRLFAAYYPHPADPSALLERVGLSQVASTPFRQLSGGEQQRLSLALALVGRPRVAFLDEPTAGVDPSGRLVIRDVVRELRAGGVSVVLTTHELDEAERLADRIVIIDRGQVVADGTPSELMAAGAGREIRFGAPAGMPVAELGAALSAAVVEERPGEYRVDAEATPRSVAALTSWLADRDLPLSDLRAGRQTLEDVFLRLTGNPSTAEVERAPSPHRGRRRRRGRDHHSGGETDTGTRGGGRERRDEAVPRS
ncbi:MAG TPA: ABC transporter ATP-binding protein [Acidimicrobiales bacterium]|nr:ABC transporter ATP-binding protein [Acidimicrobiales bacterium]